MPNQILQVDENMLETKLDRLVSEKVEQLLNAMLDAEADEITGACRRSYTLECKTNAARRALEGEPLARVARDAGCTPTSVYQWMRRYRSEGILGLMDRRNAPMPAEPMPAAGDDVEELRRQVEVLRLENAVMRETIDVLKADDPRLDPSMLTNRERTRVVDAIRGEFGLAACLKAVGLKRSTYYYERGAIAAGDRYAVLRARVAGLFEQGGRAWGYRTIHRMLRLDESDPIVVSEKVVRRIMREGAMRPVYLKRPKRWSSYAGEIGEAPANLVERDFHCLCSISCCGFSHDDFSGLGRACRPRNGLNWMVLVSPPERTGKDYDQHAPSTVYPSFAAERGIRRVDRAENTCQRADGA